MSRIAASALGALAREIECPPLLRYWERAAMATENASLLPAYRSDRRTVRRSAWIGAAACSAPFETFVLGVLACGLTLSRYGRSSATIWTPALTMSDQAFEAQLLPFPVPPLADDSPNQAFKALKRRMLDGYARQMVPPAALRRLFSGDADQPAPVMAQMRGLHDAVAPKAASLSFVFEQNADATAITLHFDAAAWSPSAAEHLLLTVSRAMEALSTGESPELGPDPAHRNLVVELGRGESVAAGPGLVERLETAARRHWSDIAVRDDGRDYSFEQLHGLRDRLRAGLLANGVGRGAVVGISMRPSVDLLATILAVISCGGIYVYLPETATDWGRQQLHAAAPIFVVSEEPPTAADAAAGRVIGLEALIAAGRDYGPLPSVVLDAEPLCYVFTSGSTQAPRAAPIPQRGAVNRIDWMWSAFPRVRGDRTILAKSPAVVGSLWDIFGGLMAGVPTVIARPQDVSDPGRFSALLIDGEVTRLCTTPVVLNMMLDECERSPAMAAQLALTFVASSADKLSEPLAARWISAFPQVPLYNMYGATECSSNTTLFGPVGMEPGGSGSRQGVIPVGRPIHNISALILDEDLRPAPLGAVGELAFAGPGVAEGYLDLADGGGRRSFVTLLDPFEVATPVFLTGDLARFDGEDSLCVVGREDFQVKVRGFRIGLETVEALLLRRPAVRRCAAAVRDGRLLAFYEADQPVTAEDLRAHMRELAPAYMTPDRFIELGALPLTSSGKVDRKALSALALEHAADDVGSLHRYANLTDYLTAVYRHTVDETMGPDSVLFEHANSLLLIRIQSILQRELGREVPVVLLMEYPTARQLAACLGQADDTDTAAPSGGSPRPRFRRQRGAHRMKLAAMDAPEA